MANCACCGRQIGLIGTNRLSDRFDRPICKECLRKIRNLAAPLTSQEFTEADAETRQDELDRITTWIDERSGFTEDGKTYAMNYMYEAGLPLPDAYDADEEDTMSDSEAAATARELEEELAGVVELEERENPSSIVHAALDVNLEYQIESIPASKLGGADVPAMNRVIHAMASAGWKLHSTMIDSTDKIVMVFERC